MSIVAPAAGRVFAVTVPVLIVGGGACGLVAALAAAEGGVDVLVLERDALPAGSTALSSGLIPAAGTRFQRARGIDDDAARFAADIDAKNKHRADPAIVAMLAREAAPTVEWLADAHGIGFDLVEGFTYPGHSARRMHGTAQRTGRQLMDQLLEAARRAGIEIMTSAQATTLYADPGGWVRGLAIERPDGTSEAIGCGALVLACNGYGGNRALVREHLPAMADALYFGHPGNQGDALLWGAALGADARDLGAYQGHGSVAHPHGILITWAVLTEGGIQVNAMGRRFADEQRGYSEHAVDVLAQPGGIAFSIYDSRCEEAALQFEDYRQAEAQGTIRSGVTVAALAGSLGLPEGALAATIAEAEAMAAGKAADALGRDFTGKPPLRPPYRGVRVTGALFHTQGGLAVDAAARVLRPDGTALPNLFAGGGAARGVSGPSVEGYLSGNGLLAAVALGRAAGCSAARLVSAA